MLYASSYILAYGRAMKQKKRCYEPAPPMKKINLFLPLIAIRVGGQYADQIDHAPAAANATGVPAYPRHAVQ
jgi:hypothetical protein